MTDRENLIELIHESGALEECMHELTRSGELADYLISKGVTIPVRCGECKHWENGDCYRIELTKPNDFCSYGERREMCRKTKDIFPRRRNAHIIVARNGRRYTAQAYSRIAR